MISGSGDTGEAKPNSVNDFQSDFQQMNSSLSASISYEGGDFIC